MEHESPPLHVHLDMKTPVHLVVPSKKVGIEHRWTQVESNSNLRSTFLIPLFAEAEEVGHAGEILLCNVSWKTCK